MSRRDPRPAAARPSVLPMGRRAALLELPTLEDAMTWHETLRAEPLPGQTWTVAAARTVLVHFETEADALGAQEHLDARTATPTGRSKGRTRRLEVVYDGEDLEEVARATRLSTRAVIDAHTSTEWTAAFGGFSPGFVYLSGGDPRLQVPRRESPRTRVPEGAVALAGEFSAVYPQPSPGGWQLIGRTDAVLWDPDRSEPALIRPGDTVRFEAVRAKAAAGRRGRRADASASRPGPAPLPVVPAGTSALEILAPGPRTLVQDEGRPGLGDLGVTISGAADGPSARQANRLVGAAPDGALLETVLGGLRVRARGDLVLALTGAIGEARIAPRGARSAPTASGEGDEAAETSAPSSVLAASGASAPVHRRPAPVHEPFGLRDGETLTLGAPAAGLRGYLAVRGGIDVPAQLGSRASDTLSGLGPRPLEAGDVLAIGAPDPHRSVGVAEVPATALPDSSSAEGTTVRIRRGPRADWAEKGALQGRSWRVGDATDRVGVRLEGSDDASPLRRLRTEELRSEGLVPGAIQLPPSGEPVLFLADHPVTGGYPVIAVVEEEDLPVIAQLVPGSTLRFVEDGTPG